MGTGARAFSSCLHGLPLAGAFSVGSTFPRELAVRRRPTASLGQPQESSQGWAAASGWLSYHPAPGTEAWPPGAGGTFLCIFSRKHLALLPCLGRVP